MKRQLHRLAIVLFLCSASLPVLAQSHPKAYAYYAPRPHYPPLPKGKLPEGGGIFTVQIDPTKGLVTSVSVKKSAGSAILDRAAIDALRRWRFRTPTKPSVDVPIDFTQ